ncbi:2-amino-4-hydroxy-6-hydroxymethyldihydropteridine diphosphokinase [Coriobacteriaceae bacterium]|nr:2-amino-4-hydroxy-6-hydroxymethyldihydropteridine diphosphokinase [Atopobiaceae bacterium FL090493]TGY59947.1 2-amino-4-hydroxy-6-hydroxymethyldihydropteridine diphosphokinase [Coriobacteriaceae bacterium]
MGILNVTPDSFSDGGEHADTASAVAHGLALLDAGADIVDVGGESTRPGFTPVDPEEEAARVVPVVRELLDAGALVSVDTRHPSVAELCVRLGAHVLNDVTGFTDPAMVKIAAEGECGVVVMHAGEVADHPTRRSVLLDSDPRSREAAAEDAEAEVADGDDAPADRGDASSVRLDEVMRRSARGVTSPTVRLASGSNRRFTLPESAPIMRRIMGFLGDQARTLMRAGVAHDRICLDPGAGFGKMADEDVVIQRACAQMVSMGYPIMCAVSRKRFVGAISGVGSAADRDAATIGAALAAAEAGARILRVHDVAGVTQALNAYWSIAHPGQSRAFVALGSNVGDRVGYLARACALINEIPLTCVSAVSHAYESEPAYGIATPVANAVAELRTELAPEVLLGHLMEVEQALGRTRPAGQDGHGPRTIDCDLVFVEGERHAGERLRLPHPGLVERDFVLVPMEDLVHDPARYLRHAGIAVLPREERVGIVLADLGPIEW